MNYGKAIAKIRELRGISRKKLAADVGIASSYIALIETGIRIPSVPMLEDIAHGLGVPLALLLLAGSDEKDLDGITPDQASTLVALGNKLLQSISKEENE